MGSFGLVHLLILLLFAAIFLVPATRVLKRVGLSPWWAVLTLIPLVNMCALWIFAFARWPKLDGAAG